MHSFIRNWRTFFFLQISRKYNVHLQYYIDFLLTDDQRDKVLCFWLSDNRYTNIQHQSTCVIHLTAETMNIVQRNMGGKSNFNVTFSTSKFSIGNLHFTMLNYQLYRYRRLLKKNMRLCSASWAFVPARFAKTTDTNLQKFIVFIPE